MKWKLRWWWFDHKDKSITIFIFLLPVLCCCGVTIYITNPIRLIQERWVGANLALYLKMPDKKASTAPHLDGRVIVLDPERSGLDPLYYELPKEMRASSHADVGTVIMVNRSTEKVGYYLVGGGSAYQHVWDLTIIDFNNQEIVAQVKFRGTEPPFSIACKQDSPCNGYGNEPEKNVLDYIVALPQN